MSDVIAQAELAVNDPRAWVCPYCSEVLPQYQTDSLTWEHCDPRPVKQSNDYADTEED